ncbi:SRPBCC family protein [Streptomyces zingiberis]|uniref:SRPBCC family protein n=1 Tax=Streptomyces zingiberis TaxID=2053010 RepID=A0ABX1BUE1_9ACTN|nr:SRPBCC family protein [Streptomyces zingiberis]NJQ01335.1 SRPBCC family protein [Streptomyces zingiberis]
MAESRGPASSLKENLAGNPAVDRLKQEASAFAAAQAQRLLVSAGQKLGTATNRLTDIAEGRDSGGGSGLLKLATEGGKKFAEGKGPLRSAVEMGASSVKDKAKEALGMGGKRKGGGGKGKFVTISEDVDVGVPLREAYNQWTQYQEFSTFAKGVQGVESADDTTTNWRAKIFWSSRSWKASVTEQIPDERIAWTSEGAKGTVKGVVTFHSLDHNLTRILMVVEYYPKGLFEKTGNIWRAQGRRARLDLKNFRRFVMMRGEATGAWRGEIRDGEVVRSHDEVVEAEEEQAERRDGAAAEHPGEGPGDGHDEAAAPHGESDGEHEEEAAYEDELPPEDAEYDDDLEDAEEFHEDEPADEEEPEDEAYLDEDADEAEDADEYFDEHEEPDEPHELDEPAAEHDEEPVEHEDDLEDEHEDEDEPAGTRR